LRFAAGCCRYPGTPFERDRADAAIEMLVERAGSPDGPAFAIFSGDQIYADATAGVFETQGRREKVAARYESAFSTPAFRELARRIPLYMTADDHEISDGWSMPSTHAPHLAPSDVFRNDRLRQWAGQLFLAYQRMHGPPPAEGAANWYRFAVAGVHFFVMDTRFERGFAEDAAPPPLCSRAQLAALGRWLDEVEQRQPGAPKFIVSGSVYAPGLAEWGGLPADRVRGDSWQGYASERAEVARLVAKARADNVVFLSGDYHCAAAATLEWLDPVAGQPLDLRAWSIVSPPLYAPFPFANSRVEDVLPEETIRDPSANATQALHAPLARCQARAFNRHGFAIVTVTHGGGAPPVIEVEFVDPFARDRGQQSLLVSVSDLPSPPAG
jgi:phosphodiesterase/alkaline phosphatase D-like protein